MGYTLLYIAFGVVALWLLGEALLQYKARLRWRLLAFVGFLGVVAGVVLSSVIVIGLGAAGFGTGQALVTLSYRRGESVGWALGGRPSTSRRRKGQGALDPLAEDDAELAEADTVDPSPAGKAGRPADEEDEPEVSAFGVEYTPAYPPEEDGTGLGGDRTQVYSPEPLHEETGEYGIYARPAAYATEPYPGADYAGYPTQGFDADGYGAPWQEQQPQPMAASYDQSFTQPYQQPFEQPGQEQFGDPAYGQQPYQSYPQYDAQHGYAQQPYPGYEQQPQPYPGYEQQQYQGYQQQPYQGYEHNPLGTDQAYQGAPGDGWSQQPYEQPGTAQPGEQAYIPQQAPPHPDETWAADPYQPRPY